MLKKVKLSLPKLPRREKKVSGRKASISLRINTALIFFCLLLVAMCVANAISLSSIRMYNGKLRDDLPAYRAAIATNQPLSIGMAESMLTDSLANSTKNAQLAFTFNVILVFVGLVCFVVTAIYIANTVSKPAKHARESLEEIITKMNDGQGDLTMRIHVKSNDEIGQLSGGINDFLHQVMKPSYRCSSNIHSGAFSYCLKSFKYLYLTFIVRLVLEFFHFFRPFDFYPFLSLFFII